MLFEFIPYHLLQTYSEPIQNSKMEHFAKIVNCWGLLTFSRKHFILHVWPGSEYASVYDKLSNQLSISNNLSQEPRLLQTLIFNTI